MRTRSPHPSSNCHRFCAMLLASAVTGIGLCQLHAAPPSKRARPPQFSKSVNDTFFPDARKMLSGPRPSTAVNNPAAPDVAPATGSVPTPGGTWSKWVTPEVLEDEIKIEQQRLARTVQNAGKFKGGDYQQARTELSTLAVMFAIAAEYDGSVRWQRQAAGVRDLLARAGAQCKVGTDAAYQEAKARADDLQLLVRGGSLNLPKAAGSRNWPQVADRAPLMKWLEQAQQQTIEPATANAKEFERQSDKLSHDAQLVAALAEVISREGYEFADDEDYVAYAKTMQSKAIELRDAVTAKNYEQARQAAGAIGKACTSCHEGYRS